MVTVFDLRQASGLHELEAVRRVIDNIPHVLGVLVDLLPEVVVLPDGSFIIDHHSRLLLLQFAELLL